MEARLGHTPGMTAYIVAKFGSLYAAYEPTLTGGQSTFFVLDSTFTFRRSLVIP